MEKQYTLDGLSFQTSPKVLYRALATIYETEDKNQPRILPLASAQYVAQITEASWFDSKLAHKSMEVYLGHVQSYLFKTYAPRIEYPELLAKSMQEAYLVPGLHKDLQGTIIMRWKDLVKKIHNPYSLANLTIGFLNTVHPNPDLVIQNQMIRSIQTAVNTIKTLEQTDSTDLKFLHEALRILRDNVTPRTYEFYTSFVQKLLDEANPEDTNPDTYLLAVNTLEDAAYDSSLIRTYLDKFLEGSKLNKDTNASQKVSTQKLKFLFEHGYIDEGLAIWTQYPAPQNFLYAYSAMLDTHDDVISGKINDSLRIDSNESDTMTRTHSGISYYISQKIQHIQSGKIPGINLSPQVKEFLYTRPFYMSSLYLALAKQKHDGSLQKFAKDGVEFQTGLQQEYTSIEAISVLRALLYGRTHR